MSTRAEFFQSMYPGLSDGEVIDELIKASIYGFEHGPEVVTISAAEGIHYVPYDAEMQKKLPYYGGTYEVCNIPFTDFQIRYQPEQIRIVDSKRILYPLCFGSFPHSEKSQPPLLMLCVCAVSNLVQRNSGKRLLLSLNIGLFP